MTKKKYRQRIHELCPKFIHRPILTLLIFMAFTLISLLILQSIVWLFLPSHKQPPFIIMLLGSLHIIYPYFTVNRWPWCLQKYVLEPKLVDDLQGLNLQHADASILDYRVSKQWWHKRRVQLFLRLQHHTDGMWFYLPPDMAENILLNEKLLGQQVHVSYLAQSYYILQIMDAKSIQLNALKERLNAPFKYTQIPHRFLQDIPNIAKITAIRSSYHAIHQLKITTNYGYEYVFDASQPHFQQLLLSLGMHVDGLTYHCFKNNPALSALDIYSNRFNLIPKIISIIILLVPIVLILIMTRATAYWYYGLFFIICAVMGIKLMKLKYGHDRLQPSPFLIDDAH